VPRRPRHYVNRAAYLGLLWVLGLTAWQMTVGWTNTATLGDAARFGLLLFQIVAFIELTLLVFFAALAAVSTITLEKDRRTFLLLRGLTVLLAALLALLAPAAIALVAWAALSRKTSAPGARRVLAGALAGLVPAAAVLLWWFLSGSEALLRLEPVARAWLHPF